MVIYPFKKFVGVSCALVCAAVLFGCSAKQGELVVAKVGNHNVTLKEYENLYLKSNASHEQAAASTQEEREKFLELMTRFRLKLADAYGQGLDKRAEIKNEIAEYKGSLVASYLTEREVNEPGIKNLYDARQVEVRASHILLSLAPNASPSDSEKVYKTAYELIAKLNAGAPFESLAVANSADPSVSQNKGDLYYFTAGRMVPEFDEAAFALKAGELTQKPVRTQYGLHIIKCVDRRPSSGEIKASHIMIRFDKENPSPEDTAAVFTKIKLIQDSLKAGVDFADLAKRNSQDPGSAPRGGDLGWFGRARWIQPFDEEAFKLKPGQVSGIVRTIYGYHLIKNYEARPPKSFEESKKDLQQVYQQTRFQGDYAKFLQRLKTQTQFSMNDKVVDQFVVAFDSTKSTRDSAWSKTLPPELGKQWLLKFGQQQISCDSVVSLITKRPDMGTIPLNSTALRQQLAKIAEQLVFQAKSETVEKDYPEFGSIMKEYTDGILLYQIEQESVWGKVAVNDTVLQTYFDATRDKFMWPDRVDISSISFYSDSLAKLVHEKLVGGKTFEQVVAEDSVRMKEPNNYQVVFTKGAAKLSPDAMKTLVRVAASLKRDATLRLQIAAQPDTSTQKAQSVKLVQQRLDAVKDQLTKKLGVDASRIVVSSRPQQKDTSKARRAEIAKLASQVSIEITGRHSWFVGGIENQLQPVTTDERTLKADSLQVGSFSTPFSYHGNVTLIRLNKKDPLRRKTYTEAGTEVSSAFQEYESTRLEKEWLERLRKQYPVAENKEALKNAFAPAK